APTLGRMEWSTGDADLLVEEIWKKLGRASVDRRSPWRTPVVATSGAEGAEARVVVLREVDAVGRRLCFHTDARSSKYAQLKSSDRLVWVFWDPRGQVQLRVKCATRLYHRDEIARAHWNTQGEGARALFALPGTPGAPLGDSTAPAHPFDAFVWVETIAESFDWLWLSHPEHMRFRFDLTTGVGQRVVP
ncbi:MAG: pyridoxamine 5'-phosphate oxidase family protein, partial [Myxococcota bacterium]